MSVIRLYGTLRHESDAISIWPQTDEAIKRWHAKEFDGYERDAQEIFSALQNNVCLMSLIHLRKLLNEEL